MLFLLAMDNDGSRECDAECLSLMDKFLRVDTTEYKPRINNNSISGHNIDSAIQSDINIISILEFISDECKSQNVIIWTVVVSLDG